MPAHHRSDGTYVNAKDGSLTPAAAFSTANSPINSAGVECDGFTTARVTIVTGAITNTPSLTVNVQTSADNGVADPWRPVFSTAAAITTATTTKISGGGLDRWVRLNATCTGASGSFAASTATLELVGGV